MDTLKEELALALSLDKDSNKLFLVNVSVVWLPILVTTYAATSVSFPKPASDSTAPSQINTETWVSGWISCRQAWVVRFSPHGCSFKSSRHLLRAFYLPGTRGFHPSMIQWLSLVLYLDSFCFLYVYLIRFLVWSYQEFFIYHSLSLYLYLNFKCILNIPHLSFSPQWLFILI